MKTISKIIQWFFAVTFALGALGTGSILSSIFVLIAAVLMAPIKPIREALLKIKIKGFIAVILSVVIFFVGLSFSPISEIPDNLDDSIVSGQISDTSTTTTTTETTTEITTEESTTIPETTTKESTTEEEITTNKETTRKKAETTTKKTVTTTKKVETTTKKVTTTKKETTTEDVGPYVYRTPSGKRYHNDPECGGKNSYKVSLKDAKKSGLTACGTCIL